MCNSFDTHYISFDLAFSLGSLKGWVEFELGFGADVDDARGVRMSEEAEPGCVPVLFSSFCSFTASPHPLLSSSMIRARLIQESNS